MFGIGSYASSSTSRITGFSGFDTEGTIKSLMDAERMPLTLLQQKRQVVEWRQAAYRDMTTSLRSFKSTYFDVVTPATNMLSSNTIMALSAKSTSDTYVTVTASAEADQAARLVKVDQLATADTAISSSGVTKSIAGTVANLDLTGKSFKLTLDGVTREISLANYTDPNPGLESTLQSAIDTAFGNGKVVVDYDGGTAANGTLSFSTANGAGKLTLTTSANTGLEDLGFTSGDTNRIKTTDTLEVLADKLGISLTFDADNVNFSINGKAFSFSKTTSLSSVMNTVNADGTANVRMSYDESSDKVTIRAKQFGAGDNIRLSETGSNLFAAFGIDPSNPVSALNQGIDAIATIDGQQVVRSSNTFSLNGVSYTLNKQHPVDATGETITVSQDVGSAVDKIKAFVEKFNTLLDNLNTKVSERYDRNYLPLTDDQKEAMNEKDIENWESRAKTGLLQNDAILQRISEDMRRALSETVEGAGLSMSEIGISSSSYLDRGKLTIDETKLRDALQNKPDQVVSLLNGTAESVPLYSRTLTAEQKETRYNQSGVFQRLSDIIDDNISILRDTNGKKGILLEKAGITGDTSITSNTITNELKTYNERILNLLDVLSDKEDAYYKRFTAMESALQKMNSQGSWLASQFGG